MNPVLEILKTRERVPLSAPPAGGPIDPDIQADIDKFEVMLAKLKAGELEEDVFQSSSLRRLASNHNVRCVPAYSVSLR